LNQPPLILDAPPTAHRIRDQRLLTVVRGLFVVALLATPTPMIGLTNPQTAGLSLGMIGILAATSATYGAALLAASRGSIRLARGIIFTMWTITPTALLLLFDGEQEGAAQALVLLLATLTLNVFQNGILALATWRQARVWVFAGASVFALALAALSWWEELAPAFSFAVLTIALFFGVASAWPARNILADLEHAFVAANAASRAKSRFLANMSHELWTPLNAILGYVQLVREDDPETPLREVDADLERIEHAGTHLMNVIGAILDLTKIEAEEAEVVFEPVDVAGLLEEVRTALLPMARPKQLRLSLEVDALPMIVTDGLKLKQIVLNLAGNAIKYTPSGSVTIRAVIDRETVAIEVQDTGVGIAPEDLERVFEPFERTEASVTRLVGGTGLGLAVCDRLAQSIGGTLEVSSELNRGSRFTLRLPRVES